MNRLEEAIEMLKILQAKVEWESESKSVGNFTIITGVKPDSTYFVLKQAVEVLEECVDEQPQRMTYQRYKEMRGE